MSEAATFSIAFHRCLDEGGKACGSLPDFARDPAQLHALYRSMVLTRCFDARAVALQRTGRLGTYASSLGQEAVSTGLAAAMQPADVLVPSFREHGAQLWRGVSMEELLLYWGGDERGSNFGQQPQDFPVSVTVGGHAPHAVGLAMALQHRGVQQAVVCVMGDGATSKGDVYEAMNLAGVRAAPVVFVVSNNQWAISVPRARQTAAATLAQKAIAAGIPGEQVDGNDVIAVRDRVACALDAARAGKGPALLEALTYRLADHTTSDDASRYRDEAEVSARWAAEPIVRLRRFMEAGKHWDAKREEALLAQCEQEVEQAAQRYLASEPQPPEAMFDFVYASLPRELARQRDEMLRGAEGAGQHE